MNKQWTHHSLSIQAPGTTHICENQRRATLQAYAHVWDWICRILQNSWIQTVGMPNASSSARVGILEAWSEAVVFTEAKAGIQPAWELRQVLIRFGAWGGSTSGVESTFAEARTASGDKQKSAYDILFFDMLVLVADKQEASIKDLCARARTIYVSIYGAARTDIRPLRVDCGKPKPRKAGPTLQTTSLI